MASFSTTLTKYCPTPAECPVLKSYPELSCPVLKDYAECPITKKYLYQDYPLITKYYHDWEHENLLSKVKYQHEMIDNMAKQLREQRDTKHEVETELYSKLQDQLDLKTRTIETLEKELLSWHSRVNNIYKRYSSLRSSSIKKNYLMEQLRSDLEKCQATLGSAISSKIELESKLREIELRRKEAEFEYNQLYNQINSRKHVTWEKKPQYSSCTESISFPRGYTCTNTCKPRRSSICALEQIEKRGSAYERIVIPYHLHALDMVDVRDIYKDSWKCDICYSKKYPSSLDSTSRYPYHCYLCNYDVCQTCVNRMEGAVVTDHFTYFTH